MKLIRRIYLVLFCILLGLGLVLPAYASESKVIYSGRAENFIFSPGTKESPTNLFPNFQNVIPGDSITQEIVVKNQDKKSVKIYLRSLGASEGSEEFLSQLKMTIKTDKNSELYEGPADETGSLTNWICLGTFKPNAEIKLNVSLEVPVTMGNEFQSEAGYLSWEFKVEELSGGSGGSTSKNEESKEELKEETVIKNPLISILTPKTGDTANIAIYSLLLILAGMGLLIAKRKY